MRPLRDAPIERKLYLIIMGTVTAVLLFSLVLSLAVQIGAARDAATVHLSSLAKVLASSGRATVAFRDPDAAAEILAALASHDDVAWASIRLPDGRLFSRYLSARHDLEGDAEHSDPVRRAGVFRLIVVEQPITVDGDVVAQLRIAGDLSRVQSAVIRQALLFLGILLVSLLVGFGLSSRLQRLVSVPVQRLLDTMREVADTQDFGRKAEKFGDDELGKLTDGFNDMLEQIQDYDQELSKYRQGLEQEVILRTEELDRARHQAVAASKAKSEFLATMSHEIRTPMTGVIGFTRLLENTELDNQQRDYTRIIGTSANALLDVIDEILDFSKMEANRVELEERDFDVENLLNTVLDTLSPRALEKGVGLTSDIAGDVPSRLVGDPQRLRQILINLVGNAVKFTDQGEVRVRLDKREQTDGRFGLRIGVSDTGIGISPEQQALLFKPFQQGDGSITRRFGGTGLGLVITQRLVHLMDGEITVSSTTGEGASFTAIVRLGHVQGAGGAASQEVIASTGRSPAKGLISAEEIAPALARLSVLVVDDSPINLKLATALLASRGVDVVGVESAVEALEIAAVRSFDLVLMDLEMPEMSGIEATVRLRAAGGEAAEVPVIAITAHAFPEKRQEVIEAGMNDLLAKPYLPEQLYAMVAKWCAGARLRRDMSDGSPSFTKGQPVCDREAALASVHGDGQVARSMLDEFSKALPHSEVAVRVAHAETDWNALYNEVHKLAGSAPIVGAFALQGSAVYLQNVLRLDPRPLDRIDAGVLDLLQQIRRFRDAVAAGSAGTADEPV